MKPNIKPPYSNSSVNVDHNFLCDDKNQSDRNPVRIRYKKTIQDSVVRAITSGEMLLEEVMEKYGIMSKKTVVRWLKRYRNERGSG